MAPTLDPFADTAFGLFQGFILVYLAYRTLLAFVGLRLPAEAPKGKGDLSFLIFIPAKNEERAIGGTVRHLFRLNYPKGKRRIVVLADDCQDATAALASSAGAAVLTKPGPTNGKGDAIRWGVAQALAHRWDWDALVIFDADSRPDPDFLLLAEGSLLSGREAIEGRIESIRQPSLLGRAYRLNAIARNRIWHLSREKLGLPAALKGTGICIRRETLEKVPWDTRTLAEDLEYAALLTIAGIRPRYLYQAVTWIEDPYDLISSVHQRLRWARGQLRVVLALGPRLLFRGLRYRDLAALDLALYLAVPTLVPLQAVLFALLVGEWLSVIDAPQLFGPMVAWPILGISALLPALALHVERRTAGVADWSAFALFMLSWLPIAVIAAATMRTHRWRATPHGQPQPPADVILGRERR